MKTILEQTKRIVYHRNGTFSFILRSGRKVRVELDKTGIECVGGASRLLSLIRQVRSGESQVYVSKRSLEKLEVIILREKIR